MRGECQDVLTSWASAPGLLWDGSKIPTNTVKQSYINHNTQELRCHSLLFAEKHKSYQKEEKDLIPVGEKFLCNLFSFIFIISGISATSWQGTINI